MTLALAGCAISVPSSSPSSAPAVTPFATATAPAPASSTAGQAEGAITVDPPEGPLDEPTSIRLSGFPPNHEVTIRATTTGAAYPAFTDTGQVRESEATFLTGSDGSVDVASQAPLRGGYDSANAMGLFWSMHETAPSSGASGPSPNDPGIPIPFTQYRYTLTAEVDGAQVATAEFVQDLGAPGITATDIAGGSIVGQFYVPPGDGPFPAVIMLQGSSGGLPVRRPKVLAADGYAVLALPFIGYTAPDGTVLPGLDDQIPLDYFGDAIRWLQAQPQVDPDRIGMYGHSLGGLATLLAASRYPQIKAAIAVAPLSITRESSTDVSAFSFKGKPVPFVPSVLAERLIQPFYDAVASDADYRATLPAIVKALEADPAIASAIVPVEKIKGSVLVVSGTADSQIPATVYGELAIDRLKAHEFAYPYQHVVTPGAGHIIDVPYADRSTEISDGGGSPEANELAGEAMWPVVLANLAAMK